MKLFLFCFGAIIGSFLNVCIYRLPRKESIIHPGSHCPHCKNSIAWYDNIPFFSYIILKGRCRNCGTGFSFRYFVVELLTAILFVVLFERFGLSGNFFTFILFCCALIVATFVDLDHRIIPDEVSVGILIVGLAINFARSLPLLYKFPNLPIVDSFIGAIFGSGLTYITAIIFNFILFVVLRKIYRIFGREFYLMREFKGEEEEASCMGGGDVSLMAMIGAFLGWRLTLLTFFIAPFLGAGVGIYILLRKKSHLIPYGPFLSSGAFVALMWGDNIIRWITILIGG